ncbi:MAG: hydroxymethylglutaryl-CoA lyase [Rhodothermia bacterium]|nr:MAG: hydroxymethylglutaryl-CoA lyase [Rhodothermia bacterium]
MPGQKFIEICEVGPRDGFQFENTPIPTPTKLEIIRGLVAAGIPRIQVTSFVHPAKVPQMADAEDVIAALTPSESVIFSGLCLNMKGLHRAAETGLKDLDLSIATNESHGLDNVDMTVEQGVLEAVEMVTEAHRLGLRVQLGLQTVFGYGYPGDTSLDEVTLIAEKFSEMNVDSISLADTTGMANPRMIREHVSAVRKVIGETPLVLHLHDTRGLGLANVFAAWEAGVSRFDTSLGGLGGCPFIKGATGNVATEDVVYLFDEMGLETGIEIPLVAECSRKISDRLGRDLAGKMYRLV